MKIRQEKNKLIILTLIVLGITWFLVGNHLFGSNIDWLSQHVPLGDLLRFKILEDGSLIPKYLPEIMGGANPYYISYYGLLRLDILIGALLPQIPMYLIISGYSILLMVLTVNLTYLFLRKNKVSWEIAFFVALSVLGTALFFQSHRQIMFVNYLPFLLIGLFGIDRYLETGKLNLFVISGIMMVFHSYFYTLANVIVCFVYFFYKNRDYKKIYRFVLSGIVIVLITSLLTVPTALAILSNSKSVQKLNYLSLFIPDFSFNSLLYQPYGCGFAYLALVGLFYGVKNLKTRYISIFMIIAFSLPLVSFICNGFLYARGKILMPFIPLVCLVIALTLEEFKFEFKKIDLFILVSLLIPIIFYPIKWLLLLDLSFTLGVLYLYYRYQYKSIIFSLLLVPLTVLVTNNGPGTFVKYEDYYNYQNEDKISLIRRNNLDSLSEGIYQRDNTNNTYQGKINKTSGYSSVYNSKYNEFYYDLVNAPISTNNRINILDQSNRIILGLMGQRNYITNGYGPVGYQMVDRQGDYYLYKSNDVLPKAYVSYNYLSYQDYKKLSYPYNLDTIYNNPIVSGKGNISYKSKFIESNLVLPASKFLKLKDNTYIFKAKKDHGFTYNLLKNQQSKILAISFKVKNKRMRQVRIKINEQTNSLSKANYVYYNGNNEFTYLISNDQVIDQLQFELTKGHYILSDLKIFSLDYNVIKDRAKEVDALKLIKTDGVLEGDIEISKDGLFVSNIPYSKGYKLFVDNKEVKITEVNSCFIGTFLKAGNHHIKITYEIPGLLLGKTLMASGLILWLGMMFYERRKLNEKNLREIVEYVIVGGLTTLVNYVIYFGLDYLWHNWLLANCLAWLGAVIFAYFANKYFVFKTEGKNMEELGKFFGLRFVTLFIENGLLFLMIDILVVNKGISKILVSFITVIGNYYLCKFKVFKKEVVNENN